MSTSWIKMKALFFRSKSNIKDSRSKYKFTTITDTFIRTRHFKKKWGGGYIIAAYVLQFPWIYVDGHTLFSGRRFNLTCKRNNILWTYINIRTLFRVFFLCSIRWYKSIHASPGIEKWIPEFVQHSVVHKISETCFWSIPEFLQHLVVHKIFKTCFWSIRHTKIRFDSNSRFLTSI